MAGASVTLYSWDSVAWGWRYRKPAKPVSNPAFRSAPVETPRTRLEVGSPFADDPLRDSRLLSRLRRPVGEFQRRTAWRTRRSIAHQPSSFITSPPTMRPRGVPLSSRSRTSKEMCQPAAPHEMKRRSMLCHSVSRVPLPTPSSSHRISRHARQLPGASARRHRRLKRLRRSHPGEIHAGSSRTHAPIDVERRPLAQLRQGRSAPARLFRASGAGLRTRISVHYSPPFCTCAPLAGPGVY